MVMKTNDKIKQGLEVSYQKLLAFKKYKKTPIIVSKNGEVTELSPDNVIIKDKTYQ